MAIGDHVVISQFSVIRYTPLIAGGYDMDAQYERARRRGVDRARAILEAAIFELEITAPELGRLAGELDAELWSKVDHLVAGEKWDQVVSSAVIFFEHWTAHGSGAPEQPHRSGSRLGRVQAQGAAGTWNR